MIIVIEPHEIFRQCLVLWLSSNFGSIVAVPGPENLSDNDISCSEIAICSVDSTWQDLRARSSIVKIMLIGVPDNLISVQGYIPRDTSLVIALRAIELVIAGGCYFPNVEQRPTIHFTQQELRVLSEVMTGAKNKEIAVKFDLTLSTVKSHMHHVMQKLGVNNRSKAILECRKRGMDPTKLIATASI